jgi:hypothetical protein
MTAKPFTSAKAKATTKGPTGAELARVHAYQRLFNGNGSKEDAEVVMTDLATYFGYYRRPTYKQWLRDRQAPAGFELHSALCNARAEVVQRIFDYVLLDDGSLVELEKAARLEARK